MGVSLQFVPYLVGIGRDQAPRVAVVPRDDLEPRTAAMPQRDSDLV
jgi:hypothetical protein